MPSREWIIAALIFSGYAFYASFHIVTNDAPFRLGLMFNTQCQLSELTHE